MEQHCKWIVYCSDGFNLKLGGKGCTRRMRPKVRCTCPLLGTLYESESLVSWHGSYQIWKAVAGHGTPDLPVPIPDFKLPGIGGVVARGVPPPISSCRGSGVGVPSPICRGSGVHPHHHPRFHPHPRFPSGVPCPGLCCATPIYASVARFKRDSNPSIPPRQPKLPCGPSQVRSGQ
jgi:hypothetical protein